MKIGKNRFSGDLREYNIIVDDEDVKINLLLTNEVDNYRPGTGHSFFQNNKNEHFFAWLPAVPQGKVSGTLSIKGKSQEISGSGYHDHNWGDALMPKLLHHWYWGRAEIGDFTIINAHMVATPKYGSSEQDIFILFKNGKLLAEDPSYVTCSFSDIYTDEKTGKPVANKIVYDYNDGIEQYKITYMRERDITNTKFIDHATGMKKLVGKLIRFDGAYLRFAGSVTVEHFSNKRLIERTTTNSAVWELMYFGHVNQK